MNLDLGKRYRSILTRVQAAWEEKGPHHHPEPPCLIAVSKTQPIEAIEELYRLGHRDFGENYVQELEEKATKLAEKGYHELRWHFVGHLQTNKVKSVLAHAYAIHSIDSEKLANEIQKRKAPGSAPLSVFLEVNIDGEESKSGLKPEEAKVMALRFSSLSGLRLEGLMCIPSADGDEAALQSSFQRLRKLESSCRPHTHGKLSMGMTHDFELALRQGASHIRVGTGIFGERIRKD